MHQGRVKTLIAVSVGAADTFDQPPFCAMCLLQNHPDAGPAFNDSLLFTGAILRVFAPDSPQARSIYDLGLIAGAIFAAIFVIVTAIVVYALMRFRSREGEEDPHQYPGNRKIEITWTVIPCVIVVILFALTARAMRASDPPPAPSPDIIVVGHQWWWEMRYPGSGAITANEIHIPIGKPLSLELDSADVLHEFWVPELGRKMTAVPGHPNHIWIQADHAGNYLGFCTEYCGNQHAWMHFLVVAEPPEQFEAWLQAQLQSASGMKLSDPVAEKGRALFQQWSCSACHAINGTAARARVGPDLTHFGSRSQLGAGIMDNTLQNLRVWLTNPQKVKPGIYMPDFKLTKEQVAQLAAYLETLK